MYSASDIIPYHLPYQYQHPTLPFTAPAAVCFSPVSRVRQERRPNIIRWHRALVLGSTACWALSTEHRAPSTGYNTNAASDGGRYRHKHKHKHKHVK